MTHLHYASLLGWVARLLLAWGVSYDRKRFPGRTVLWGAGVAVHPGHFDFAYIAIIALAN